MLWAAFFIISGIAFLAITLKDMRYLFYGIFGSVFGLLFDITAVSQGYYTYTLGPAFMIFDIPLSVTVAEGFCISITIFLFEKLIKPRI